MLDTELIPLAQVELRVSNVPFAAVLLPDGQTGAVPSMLCEALDLRSHSQAQRLKSHPVLALALVLAQIETAGGPQTVNILLSWGVPLWLASIRPGGRPPAYRKRLLAMQQEVGAALSRHFSNERAENGPTLSASPAETSETKSLSPWETLYTALTTLEAQAQTFTTRLRALEMRVAQPQKAEYHPLALERLLAATIERVLEHERRLNQLKRPGLPKQSRTPRSTHRRKRRFLAR
jgi:hypothetical protein